MTTTTPTARTRARRSTLDRTAAFGLAATEYGRYLDQLRSLTPDEWARPTQCEPWDVRSMATHNLGMVEMAGSLGSMVRQFAAAGRRPENGVDALTAHQVEARRDMGPAEIIDRYARATARAVRGRRRRSALIGRVTAPEKQVVDGAEEPWTFGYMFETILTRDTWMHRIDTAQATDRQLVLTADHDGALVSDIVTEWAQRHGKPFHLQLAGPAGGTWSVGTDGEEITLDAVEFARTLSGRASGSGLLSVQIPF